MIYLGHNDPDGVMSHTILEMALGKGRHLFGDYEEIMSTFQALLQYASDELLVFDLGYSKELKKLDGLMPQIRRLHNPITWIDHHEWPENLFEVNFLNYVSQFILDKQHCTAEIIQHKFAPNNQHAKDLAAIARADDFLEINKNEYKIADDFNDLLAYGFSKNRLVNILSQSLWNNELEKAKKDLQPFKQKALTQIKTTAQEFRLNGYSCVVGLVPDFFYAKRGVVLLDQPGLDLVLAVYQKYGGKFVLKSNHPDLVAPKIASAFGGGGRGQLGGANLGNLNEHNYQEVVDNIKQKLEYLLKK